MAPPRLLKRYRRKRVLVNTKPPAKFLWLGLALALSLAVGALAGCSNTAKTPETTSATTPAASPITAKQAFAIAQSTLASTAPDGKLLLGQSAVPTIPTPSRDWEFLIGSPKHDALYAVFVHDGGGRFEDNGAAHFTKAEWAAVPGPDAWRIDSDVALAKALAVHPQGKGANYFMGFVTYKPKADAPLKARFMKWVIGFDVNVEGNAPTSTVLVDMFTGEAAYAQ